MDGRAGGGDAVPARSQPGGPRQQREVGRGPARIGDGHAPVGALGSAQGDVPVGVDHRLWVATQEAQRAVCDPALADTIEVEGHATPAAVPASVARCETMRQAPRAVPVPTSCSAASLASRKVTSTSPPVVSRQATGAREQRTQRRAHLRSRGRGLAVEPGQLGALTEAGDASCPASDPGRHHRQVPLSPRSVPTAVATRKLDPATHRAAAGTNARRAQGPAAVVTASRLGRDAQPDCLVRVTLRTLRTFCCCAGDVTRRTTTRGVGAASLMTRAPLGAFWPGLSRTYLTGRSTLAEVVVLASSAGLMGGSSAAAGNRTSPAPMTVSAASAVAPIAQRAGCADGRLRATRGLLGRGRCGAVSDRGGVAISRRHPRARVAHRHARRPPCDVRLRPRAHPCVVHRAPRPRARAPRN